MPKRHGAREQKKAAKQKAKRNARRKQLARASSPDPTVRLKHAEDWPIVACLVPEELWVSGLGQMILARRLPDGQVAVAAFLVDEFCLGIKNAFWQVGTAGQLNEAIERIEEHGPLWKASPEYFSKLVHCAADYAQELGFAPHRDFRHARLLLAGIDPSRCREEFEFGQNGRPLYIQGPGESPDKVRSIIARVQAAGGHFIARAMVGSDPTFEFEDEYEDDDDDVDDYDGDDEADDGDDVKVYDV
jgi:hypothetical protein